MLRRLTAVLLLAQLATTSAPADPMETICQQILAGTIGTDGLRVALRTFDRDVWTTWLNRVATDGETNATLQDVRGLAATMPPALREAVLARAARLRAEAPKNIAVDHYDPTTSLPPRRALDQILTTLMNPKERFEDAIARGASPREAYQQYLSQIQERLGRTQSERYDVDRVLAVARAMQEVLKKHRNDRSWTRDPYVVLAGSFPNGRARITESDLDVVMVPPALDKLTASFTAAVAAAMPKGASLPVEHRPEIADPIEHEHFFATINPIVIVVNPDSIELRVYPLGTTRYYDRGPRVEPLRFTF